MTRSTRWTAAAGLAAALPLALGGLASTATTDTTEQVERPETFTSAFVAEATGDQVVGPDGTVGVGQEDGSGTFIFLINSDEEIICWDITTEGVDPPYQSAARTATHIHQTPAGQNGPPRLSFPNPGPEDSDIRNSSGCSEGPFTTGLSADGQDSGTGFTLDQIEANPAGFSADTHTAANVPGAVRGQLAFSQELLDEANGAKNTGPVRMLRVFLKYGPRGEKLITGVERISRPGRRVYFGRDDVPEVLAGLGTSILTTSRGVMTGREAVKAGVGGEVLCNIW